MIGIWETIFDGFGRFFGIQAISYLTRKPIENASSSRIH
jgi:hypothetical protein